MKRFYFLSLALMAFCVSCTKSNADLENRVAALEKKDSISTMQIEGLSALAYTMGIDTLSAKDDSLNVAAMVLSSYRVPPMQDCIGNCGRQFRINYARCETSSNKVVCRRGAFNVLNRCLNTCQHR